MHTPATKFSECGSVLLVSVCAAAVIGIALASYLVLVQNTSTQVARSQTWNDSLVVTEAGIEDGMQFINKYAGTPILPDWTNSYSSDNWSQVSAGVYIEPVPEERLLAGALQ